MRGNSGLTLIELVVVLVVLVALASLLVPFFGQYAEDARQQSTRTTLARTAQAIVGTGGYEQSMRFAVDADGDPYGDSTGLPWPAPADVDSGARVDHPQLHFLLRAPVFDAAPEPDLFLGWDALTRVGWNGPWLDATVATRYALDLPGEPRGFKDRYGLAGDLAPIDGCGNPVVIQLPRADPTQKNDARLVSAGPDGVLQTPTDVNTPTLAEKGDDLVLYLFREDPNL